MTMGSRRSQGRSNQLALSIPSRLSAIDGVCAQIRTLLRSQRLERLQFQVEIVVRECLNNAITHGNDGLPESWVSFAMRVERRRICLHIADQGPGFDWRPAARRGWPGATETAGRGLLLIGAYARRVRFNRQGNQVTLWIDTAREER